MFAITGITGRVGSAVAERLLAEGVPVRAVARDAAKAERWRRRGCDVALAEMSDRNALARAFANAAGVFILLPPLFDPAPGFPEMRSIIAAVRGALEEARPARVVCLSTVGAQAAQENLLSQLGLMERELSGLDLPVAFLRAAWFMENAAWDVAPAREEGVLRSFLQPLDRAIPMVATADIGALAAKVLQGDWIGRRVIELQAPALVSPNDLAAALAKLLDRPVVAEAAPRSQWEGVFRAQGMHNPEPRMRMLDGFNEGWIAFEGGPRVASVKGPTPLETALRPLL
ncbi:NmrA family protein [Methylocella silvestris BL2]|uniref:NmrA family protein n=1 Tax=Methylocella silvestris (strain DSM 15510 / CIP 108128 / LMG 27833 / NCIMB 13906 / BL2) TaxID=395965 RepID=B8EQA9_METSB|nr:NAD(P)H-binding protein [Methylocella silvestris]ACK51599.1 NmrA family protein [Methylocella silvestris BL2]